MEQREREHEAVVAVQRQARRSASQLASMLPCVSMAPFGVPGRARRVAEQRDVVRADPVERRRVAVGQVDRRRRTTTGPGAASAMVAPRLGVVDDRRRRRAVGARCGRARARGTRRSPGTTTSPARSAATCATTRSNDVAALITMRSPPTSPAPRVACRHDPRSPVEVAGGVPRPRVVDQGAFGRRRPPLAHAGGQAAAGQEVDGLGPYAVGEVARPRRVHRRGGYRGGPVATRRLTRMARSARSGLGGRGPVLGAPARRDAPRRPAPGGRRAQGRAHRGARGHGQRAAPACHS